MQQYSLCIIRGLFGIDRRGINRIGSASLLVLDIERAVPAVQGRRRDDIRRKHTPYLPPVAAAPHQADVLEALPGAGLGHPTVVASANERHHSGPLLASLPLHGRDTGLPFIRRE